MELIPRLSEKQWEKLIKKSARDTTKDLVYEYGQTREMTKQMFDMNNSILLFLLQSSNKNNDYKLEKVEKIYKEIKKQNLNYILLYLITIIKFILLTLTFGSILFILGKWTDRLHKYIQDYIFSIIMIIYSACLYKFIGDEFKTLLYSNHCFNYSKKKFKFKMFFVNSNLVLKNMLENGVYDSDDTAKSQVIQVTKNNDKTIEEWKKL